MTEPRTLPRGTLTFLFTDIEGSTTLERTIGRDRYAELLARHRTIAREAWAANGGHELGTEGDSFFVYFQESWQAVAAAVAAQLALGGEAWPDDATIRIRIGINTGDAEQSGDSYVGLGVNRAARIAAIAAGGQILVSGTTRDLYGDHPVGGVTLRDLGEHRLKDLGAPVRIYQVEADGLATDFAPLRTLDTHPNNLPAQLTTFVGRDAELDEAEQLLATTRLLTLTGPGGTGKTRLSLQLAARVSDDFPDGVFFVPLEPIRDPMLVAPRISTALGITEGGTRPIGETLAEWLRDKRLLLVLDNFEQVVTAGTLVADLLRAAPDVKAIVTSRAVLHVSGEQEYPVPGLPAPPDPSHMSGLDQLSVAGEMRIIDPVTLGHYGAVRLFIERAVAVRPGFVVTNENAPAVAAISARLHGMPLAIELAAARIKILSPEAILVRLDQQLDVLAAGARDLPPRQQTLRGAIAWSYELLDDGGRRLLDRLSVFASGCDLASAEAICGPASEIGGDILDGLMALVDQSLVKAEEASDGEPRFRLLDTIRAFSAEKLEADGEVELIRGRHRDWYVALAERAAAELSGADQRRWLDRLELEHDDIRAVLDRAVAAPDPPVAIGVAYWMWRFWQKHGHLAEARRRLETMAAAPWSHEDPRLRARLMEALGGTYWWQGEIGLMAPCYAEALELWLAIGDQAEIANAYYNSSFQFAVPDQLGGMAKLDAEGLGLDYLEKARQITHDLGDARREANALWGLANYRYFQRYPDFGLGAATEALDIFRTIGDRTMEAWSLHMVGTAQLRLGDYGPARANVTHAMRHFYDSGDAAGITLTLDDLSSVAVAEGDLPRAARLRGAARNLTALTGTGLAGYVDEVFESGGVRPAVRGHMPDEDVARYGSEGAAMTLDEAVAYALEGSAPTEPEP
ncbi:MAG: adenylate/guanylate cyclase domain-containing protein [Chloroflexota bacterium]